MTGVIAQLQKPLQGLARFLGLQSQGALQVTWQPILSPVYDLSDWIGPPVTIERRSTTVALDSAYTLVTVPQGETWRIYCITCFVKPAANNPTNSYIRLLRNGSSHGQVLAPQNGQLAIVNAPGSVVTNSRMHVPSIENGYSFTPPKFFVFSGDALEIKLQGGLAAGNNEVRSVIQYQNLSV